MATWIHFTAHPEQFADGLESIDSDDFDRDGLYVYRYTEGLDVQERSRKWNYREPVYIRCDEEYVELVQTDPLGNDPTWDEYLIPVEHFDKCGM